MTWYQVKGLLLWPYLTFNRFRYRNASKLDKSILEANRYSRAFSGFAQANINSQLLVHDLNLQPESLVMDVGGFDGDWTAAVREHFDSIVHVYEPMPSAIEKLHTRFDGDAKVAIHPVGLASRSGEENLSLLGPGSSMIETDVRRSATAAAAAPRTVRIQLQDVESAFKEFEARPIDLFKINIEGAEFEVLQSMLDHDLHKRCRVLMIQYHEFAPNAHKLRRDINRELAKTHKAVWSYDFVWERWEIR